MPFSIAPSAQPLPATKQELTTARDDAGTPSCEPASAAASADAAAAAAVASARAKVLAAAALTSPSVELLDTHEVSVTVDEASGEYALACRSCEWSSPRNVTTLHGWRERALDFEILMHVEFGGADRRT